VERRQQGRPTLRAGTRRPRQPPSWAGRAAAPGATAVAAAGPQPPWEEKVEGSREREGGEGERRREERPRVVGVARG
jgi:hypothetical protein